ncbi:unnamed protein product [Haemonchus placei]|uniref:Myb-like domain-containing protein n=1 Tax=Haemonchus placei TaxID=6290 RepID=A0A0N4VVG7_HAEPC|nr:unnamed protein product [Haemonchus placei]
MGQPWEPFTLGLFDVNTSYTCVLECRVKLKTAQLTRSGSQVLERPGVPSQEADPWSEQDFISRSGSTRLNEPSAQSQELYRSKTVAWSTQELEKLANLAERHRTAKGRVQWAVLEREFSSSATHDDPIRTAESLRAAYRRFFKTSTRTSGVSTQRAEVHSMERAEENPNDLSSEDRRPGRVSTGQMNINHAYDSAMSDGVTTAQQTLIASTSGAIETASANSAHVTELPPRKRTAWTESELGKLANLVERHRTADGGVQWAELGSAWESSRRTQDPKRTVSALKAAYAKLSKKTRQTDHSAASDGLADLRTSSIPSCPQVGSPREAHASQQNEDPAGGVSRLQFISDGRSSPTQGTRSPLGLRIISSRGDRPQGGGTTETPESQPIETLPQRKRNVWTESELGKLANLVERHRTANGSVQWAELGSAWESLRSTQEPKRTVSALKAAYAKLSKRIRQVDHSADSDGLADLRIPSSQSCSQADSQMGAHVSQQEEELGNVFSLRQSISDDRSPPAQLARSPSDLRTTPSRGDRPQGGGTTGTLESQSIETLPQRKRNLWTESELGRLPNLVERHRTAKGGVQWTELGSAWESSRSTQDPKRTVKALQAAYAKLAKRAESIAVSEGLAVLRTSSRNSCPQQGSQNTVFESQPDVGGENPGHQVSGEVASLQYNTESSEGTTEIENQSPEGNSQELSLGRTHEPQ